MELNGGLGDGDQQGCAGGCWGLLRGRESGALSRTPFPGFHLGMALSPVAISFVRAVSHFFVRTGLGLDPLHIQEAAFP